MFDICRKLEYNIKTMMTQEQFDELINYIEQTAREAAADAVAQGEDWDGKIYMSRERHQLETLLVTKESSPRAKTWH
jgi:hypothetical protein